MALGGGIGAKRSKKTGARGVGAKPVKTSLVLNKRDTRTFKSLVKPPVAPIEVIDLPREVLDGSTIEESPAEQKADS